MGNITRAAARVLFLSAFIFLSTFITHQAQASEVCPIKSIAVTNMKCDRGLSYVGPINRFRFGGFCIYPLTNCIQKIEDTTRTDCGSGTYVGPKAVERIGGQCLYPAPGWVVEKREAASLKDCQPSEIFFGPSNVDTLGGHCVKLVK